MYDSNDGYDNRNQKYHISESHTSSTALFFILQLLSSVIAKFGSRYRSKAHAALLILWPRMASRTRHRPRLRFHLTRYSGPSEDQCNHDGQNWPA